MEATKLLKQQHDEVRELFERFEAAEEDSEKQELFDQIADDFAAHGEIEEQIFYPAVYVGTLKEKLQEAVEEHLAAKRVVADLLDLEPSDAQFNAKMNLLTELIEHHVEEEEGGALPAGSPELRQRGAGGARRADGADVRAAEAGRAPGADPVRDRPRATARLRCRQLLQAFHAGAPATRGENGCRSRATA